MRTVLLPILSLIIGSASGQLVIDQATFFIGEGAVVTVQGNLQTNVAIQAGGSGATQGKIQMKGSGLQTITATSATAAIPHLEIDNASNVTLGGSFDLKVDNRLNFVNGRLQLAGRNLIVPDNITFVGLASNRFIETNGAGEVRQMVPAPVASPKVIPVGNGSNYSPAQYTATGVTVNASSYIGIRATGAAIPTPERHPRTETYLGTAWSVSRSGITGGTVNVQGTYVDGQILGLGTPVESDIVGMFWNGSTWSLAGGAQNAANNTVAANVPGNGIVYGMNKFILANVKTYLQGAFNAGTGLMRDQLRTTSADYTSGNPAVNPLIPLNDPYRTADYNTFFVHTNNATAESIAGSVLNNAVNAGDNIVDWVFLELRSNANPSTVLQTRSALIQRDGDIVDVDGVSSVYFKNVDGANYNVAIKHRNHVGVRTANASALSLNQPVTQINLSSAAANYLNNNVAQLNPGVFGLFGGNANKNLNTRISGPDGVTSDFEFLKAFIGASPQVQGYSSSDVNMNRSARISGADATISDFEFIKAVLGSAAQRAQGAL
ncbi:MAG: hypothetical protein MUE71_00180 [Chitinophagaceae bacterium]|nr:hypothetical protein [Chitinophagaceae bacterium]